MNKKGDLELIKGLVIIILAGVVVGYFALNIMNVFEKNVDDDVCKTAVNLASIKVGPDVASVRVLSDEKKIAKNCPYNEYTDIPKSITHEDMVNIISKEIWECWDRYGRGNVDFMSNMPLEVDHLCFKCTGFGNMYSGSAKSLGVFNAQEVKKAINYKYRLKGENQANINLAIRDYTPFELSNFAIYFIASSTDEKQLDILENPDYSYIPIEMQPRFNNPRGNFENPVYGFVLATFSTDKSTGGYSGYCITNLVTNTKFVGSKPKYIEI